MRRRKRVEIEYEDAELNIMPFIDVFSVLNTFLLFSAVFISLGILQVQVPFLSNKDVPDKPKRSLEVKVDARVDKLLLTTSYSLPPKNERVEEFTMNDVGFDQLHARLVTLRSQNKDTDLVTLFCDDEIKYEVIIKIIDAIKNRKKNDPVFASETEGEDGPKVSKNLVFPKVVMGSVLL